MTRSCTTLSVLNVRSWCLCYGNCGHNYKLNALTFYQIKLQRIQGLVPYDRCGQFCIRIEAYLEVFNISNIMTSTSFSKISMHHEFPCRLSLLRVKAVGMIRNVQWSIFLQCQLWDNYRASQWSFGVRDILQWVWNHLVGDTKSRVSNSNTSYYLYHYNHNNIWE